eukprot:COSAG02_NODE_311_length_24966_cov_1089.426187_12_plen_197_part_00
MPRRPRKNTTMDQFLTKPAGAAADAEQVESCSPQEQAAASAAAPAVDADLEPGGTPLKKRPRRSSTAARTLAPQRLLQHDSRAAAAVPQPLLKSSVDNCRDEASPRPVPTAREPPPPLTEEQERLLKDFDLRSRFGAAAGVDRLVRWERAHRLGLRPPDVVKEILLEYAEVPEARRCVLDAHLLRYDPGGDSGIRC